MKRYLSLLTTLAALTTLATLGCAADSTTTATADAAGPAADVSTATDDVEQPPDRFWEQEPPSDDPYFADGGYRVPRSEATVVQTFDLQGTTDGTIALGFDLDGQQSTDNDETSCYHADLKSPDGVKGIDNQFARVWDIVETLVGDQVRALLQEAINEGRFLLIIEISDLDDPLNDDDVTIRMLRGQHSPKVGSSGLLLPSQTYAIDGDFPVSTVENVALVNGVIEAGPVEVLIPIEIFDANFILPIEQGRVRLERQADGSWTGLLGGQMDYGAAIDQLLETGGKTEAELVAPILESNADMGHNGETCETISAAFAFTTIPAFVLRFPTPDSP